MMMTMTTTIPTPQTMAPHPPASSTTLLYVPSPLHKSQKNFSPSFPLHLNPFISKKTHAQMHILTSTCTLTLLSPLPHSTIFVTSLNATALHNGSIIGSILYDLPFAVPPGASTSPHLPVDWSLDSVGYEELKQALGGNLKVDARAEVGIRLGQWVEQVWFVAKGVGARVRI